MQNTIFDVHDLRLFLLCNLRPLGPAGQRGLRGVARQCELRICRGVGGNRLIVRPGPPGPHLPRTAKPNIAHTPTHTKSTYYMDYIGLRCARDFSLGSRIGLKLGAG